MAKYANPSHVVLDPGHNFTGTATAAIAGKLFVQFAAGGRAGLPSLAVANATSGAVGVAKYTAASGETMGVITGGHCAVTAGGTISAGNPVYVDAAGKASATVSGPRVGTAYTDAVLNGDVYVQLSV